MKRKLMPIVVVGLLLGTVLTVNSVAWSFEKRSLSRIPADQIVPVKPPVAAGEKNYCELEYTNWITGFYFADWRPGDKNAIYFDPEDCGFQTTYPFQLTDVHFVIFDHAEVGSVDVRFSVEVISPDICEGPGIEIWKSEVYTIKTFWPSPKTIIFPDTVCLDRPFFFNVEYISDHAENTTPSLLFDTDTLAIDTCYQWFWYEDPPWNWHEWYDAWTSIPGWVILRISGHCGEEQTECGDLWYWKADKPSQDPFPAPSGMPDFDQYQFSDSGSLCGPTAVANCLWWFNAVPTEPSEMSPPDLIRLLCTYMKCDPYGVGTYVDSMQSGLDQYFTAYGFNLYEHTYEEPYFHEMEDSLKKSQDIILLLGFYDEQYARVGGHFVTMAGVCSESLKIAVSDPAKDAAVYGWPGRVRLGDHPEPPVDPTKHNDPSYVSQDIYLSSLESPTPGNPHWGLPDYLTSRGVEFAARFLGQNFQPGQEPFKGPDAVGPAVFTEVEYAVMICPKGTAVEGEEGSLTPKVFELDQNYPNPFNNETVIKFGLRRPASVTLTIYNILGQKVRTLVEGRLSAGPQVVSWDGKDDKGNDLSSGIYFYQLRAGEMSETKRLVLLK